MPITVIQCATPFEFEGLRQAFAGALGVSGERIVTERVGRRRFFQAGENCFVLRGSVGRDRAAASCEFAIERWAPGLVVDFGAAGGLDPDLRPGDVVVSGAAGERAGLESALSETSRVVRGTIADSHVEARSREARLELFRATGAVAVSWESAAIARVCQERGVAFACVRVVTDVGEGELREEYEEGARRFLPLAAAGVARWVLHPMMSGTERL